jgi:hypothetical protein
MRPSLETPEQENKKTSYIMTPQVFSFLFQGIGRRETCSFRAFFKVFRRWAHRNSASIIKKGLKMHEKKLTFFFLPRGDH